MSANLETLCEMLDGGSISAAEALEVDSEYASKQNELAKLRFENERLRDALETIDCVLRVIKGEG